MAGNDRIDSRYLRRFPKFVEFQRGDDREEEAAEPEKAREANLTAETTPEELILSGYKHVHHTTSSFSTEAPQYAERIDTRIILIDGTELAKLMIAHGVGVTAVAVYELKRVDSDFFAED